MKACFQSLTDKESREERSSLIRKLFSLEFFVFFDVKKQIENLSMQYKKKMPLLYPEESYKLIGAIYEVHKELGPGLLEKVYQEALEKELKLQGIPFEREKSFSIVYKGEELEQKYIADFVCYDKIILELKAVDDILPAHKAQVINYLAITGYKLGLLVNFNSEIVKPERIVRY